MPHLEGKRVLLTGASGFIGTNFVDLLLGCGATVANADIAAPMLQSHNHLWRHCDVGDLTTLQETVGNFNPHYVVHLAARTDTSSTAPADYDINHIGTGNVARALLKAPGCEKFIFVSSQFVLGPAARFTSETNYAPHTAYGESKAQAEIELRGDPPQTPWTIVRPTNVWGPWHLRYQSQFWRVLRRGMYLHPDAPDPIRSYGYIGSVCLQMLDILLASAHVVHGRALYVGDQPAPLSEWVDAFSVALRGKPARRVPGRALATLARFGDIAQRTGIRMPMNTSRYSSMTSDYPTPMNLTSDILGRLQVLPLSFGVTETVRWLHHGAPADITAWLMTGAVAEAPSSSMTDD